MRGVVVGKYVHRDRPDLMHGERLAEVGRRRRVPVAGIADAQVFLTRDRCYGASKLVARRGRTARLRRCLERASVEGYLSMVDFNLCP